MTAPDIQYLVGLYRPLYERIRKAGGRKRPDGRLSITVDEATHWFPSPTPFGVEAGVLRRVRQGESRELIVADIADYFATELAANVERFERDGQKRAREVRAEDLLAKKIDRTEKLGRTLDWISQLRKLPRGAHVWAWHGTSSRRVPRIRREGLDPDHAGQTWTKDWQAQGVSPGVFLSLRPDVEFYAGRARGQHGGKAVTLRVLVPAEILEPDPDDADISSGAWQVVVYVHIPPSAIYQIDDKWIRFASATRRKR